MSTEVATRNSGTALTIADGQHEFTGPQLATLRQLGVTGASREDLAVFFHQVVRTGLDPFARQIYMIERQGKQTIQTGIDGFRLIGRRAVDRTHETLEVSEAEWCGKDGVWHDVWLSNEPPAAARVTVYRNGGKFPAIAMYSEYVATKRDGNPNAMWASRPAGQLAKCAEALAWRKAFPQDLSGLYTSDEMAQASNVSAEATAPAPEPARTVTRQRKVAPPEPGAPERAPAVESATMPQLTKINIILQEQGITDRDDKLAYLSSWTGRTLTSSKELTKDEAHRFIEDAEQAPIEAELVDEDGVLPEPEAE